MSSRHRRGAGQTQVTAAHGFPQHEFPAAFTALLHERTGGNPFFLVNAVDYLEADGLIVERGGQWRLTVALADCCTTA